MRVFKKFKNKGHYKIKTPENLYHLYLQKVFHISIEQQTMI